MNDLSKLEARILRVGVFVLFLVSFAKYISTEIWHLLKPILGR